MPSREARPPGRAAGTVKQNAHGAHRRVTQPLAVLTQGRPRGGPRASAVGAASVTRLEVTRGVGPQPERPLLPDLGLPAGRSHGLARPKRPLMSPPASLSPNQILMHEQHEARTCHLGRSREALGTMC